MCSPPLDRERSYWHSPCYWGKNKIKASQEEARRTHQRIVRTIDSLFGLLRTVVRTGGWVVAMWLLYLSVKSIAGQHTEFNTTLRGIVNVSASKYVGYVLAVAIYGAYRREKSLKQKAIRDLDDHVKQLERRIDPNRSSSRLTASGTPRPEDLDEP